MDRGRLHRWEARRLFNVLDLGRLVLHVAKRLIPAKESGGKQVHH